MKYFLRMVRWEIETNLSFYIFMLAILIIAALAFFSGNL